MTDQVILVLRYSRASLFYVRTAKESSLLLKTKDRHVDRKTVTADEEKTEMSSSRRLDEGGVGSLKKPSKLQTRTVSLRASRPGFG